MSEVEHMFRGRSILITGASGFIGRVLVEKILRSYPNVKNIYLLLRTKKNFPPKERLNKDILNAKIFDKIKQQDNCKELFDKIIVVSGDIQQPNLGISERDFEILYNDKDLAIVFHCAATIKFDEPLHTSIKLNLIATKAMLDMSRKFHNLVCFCHVSTAYVNSDIKNNADIEEVLYPMKQKPREVIKMAESMDEDLMQILKPCLVDQRPNTYTYTKSLAEHLVYDDEYNDMPICIVRPSIVTAAWKEPIKGWVDNLNGPTGLILAIGKGLLRTMHVKGKVVADMIPVDVVVNTMIATSFYTAKKYNKLDEVSGDDRSTTSEEVLNEKQTPLIVHCTSGDTNPITWGQAEREFFPAIRANPSSHVLRYPFGSFKESKIHDLVTRFFVHILPALLIDLLCCLIGKKRQLLYIYKRLHSAVEALEHFCTQNYNFKSRNINLVENSLNDFDKHDLYVSIKEMSWINYWHDYVLGTRQFVLKESNDTLPKARESLNRAYYVEMVTRFITMFLVLYSFKGLMFTISQV